MAKYIRKYLDPFVLKSKGFHGIVPQLKFLFQHLLILLLTHGELSQSLLSQLNHQHKRQKVQINMKN
jgi:hypothetical protein